jgi:tagatose-1,6-bisphosphate aldolase non-catalytic subunit AgaZ/GatZ
MVRADRSRLREAAEARGQALAEAVLQGLRERCVEGGIVPTVLAICPNSEAVVKAAMVGAKEAEAPLFFAATLNQVDLDGGYTGWRQTDFVALAREKAARYRYEGPIVVGLDHGGPWLKDKQTQEAWPLARAMAGVKESLTACVTAGYDLLHVDPTVDRTRPKDQPMPIELVIERTLELIAHAESQRRGQGLPPVSYEVGTEEVHGGLADMGVFRRFLEGLKEGLSKLGLSEVWPCFVVGKVGTDLHTTEFDPEVARKLAAVAGEYGSVIKGHYSDSVSNPEAYPLAGMGGANVGPEFTEAEYAALQELTEEEKTAGGARSGMMEALRAAVVASGRWEKWRLAEEQERSFDELSAERQGWLVRTGCRYIWSAPEVLAARKRLYENVRGGEDRVLRRIAAVMGKYYRAFRLEGTLGRM